MLWKTHHFFETIKRNKRVFLLILCLCHGHWFSCEESYTDLVWQFKFKIFMKQIIVNYLMIKHQKMTAWFMYLTDITVYRNKKICNSSVVDYAYCDLSRQVELCNVPGSVEIETKHNAINSSDSTHFFLAWINMQNIFLAIHRVIYFAYNRKKKNSKRTFSILIKLELSFSLGSTPLNLMNVTLS